MPGWGGAIEKVGGIIDGLFGLSPEEKVKRLRNKINEAEQERKKVLNEPSNINNDKRLGIIDSKLSRLRKELQNCA